MSLLTQTAQVYRRVTNGSRSSFSDTPVATVKCSLQPISPTMAQALEMSLSKTFRCLVGLPADVQTGDRLVIDGETYTVNGSKKRNFGNLANAEFWVGIETKEGQQ